MLELLNHFNETLSFFNSIYFTETFPGAFLIFTACLYVMVGILLLIANLGLKKIDSKKVLPIEPALQQDPLLSKPN